MTNFAVITNAVVKRVHCTVWQNTQVSGSRTILASCFWKKKRLSIFCFHLQYRGFLLSMVEYQIFSHGKCNERNLSGM